MEITKKIEDLSKKHLEEILIKHFGEEFVRRRFNYSKWNGAIKQYTKNCKGCAAYIEIEEIKYCLHGDAWKILADVDKPQKCLAT